MRLLEGHGVLVAGALALVLIGSVLGLLQPIVAGQVIDAVGGGRPTGGLVLTLIALFTVQVIVDTAGRYFLERTGEGVVVVFRRRLISRFLRLHVSVLDRHRLGDLISRASNDAAALQTVAARAVADITVGALTAVGAVVLMVSIDPVLFVVVLALFAVAAAGVAAVSNGIQTASQHKQAAVGRFSADLERALSAIRTIKVARAEDREITHLFGEANAAYTAGLRMARLSAAAMPAVQLAATGSFLLVLVIGGMRVTSGAIGLGSLVAVLLYATYLVVPLGSLLEGWTSLKQTQGALNRVNEALQLPVEPEEEPATQASRVDSGRRPPSTHRQDTTVRFSAVSFSYGDSPALREVSFTLSPGSRTALIGPSGSGKSTVLALICRFYEPDAGVIELGGRPVTDLTMQESRKLVALVEQDAPVLHGTIRDNLSFTTPTVTDAELHEVLRRVNLHHLLARSPRGLDSAVGEHGKRLSGGERQRLAIARALLTQPDVLLLDEPTASLDSDNENAVLRALDQLPETCAVLFVTHRTPTLRLVDQILLLVDGEIAARGDHTELLTSNASFRRMVNQEPGVAGLTRQSISAEPT